MHPFPKKKEKKKHFLSLLLNSSTYKKNWHQRINILIIGRRVISFGILYTSIRIHIYKSTRIHFRTHRSNHTATDTSHKHIHKLAVYPIQKLFLFPTLCTHPPPNIYLVGVRTYKLCKQRRQFGRIRRGIWTFRKMWELRKLSAVIYLIKVFFFCVAESFNPKKRKNKLISNLIPKLIILWSNQKRNFLV